MTYTDIGYALLLIVVILAIGGGGGTWRPTGTHTTDPPKTQPKEKQ